MTLAKTVHNIFPPLNGAKLRAVLDGMDFSPSLQTILFVFSPVHTARSGQESLAQGSPWVSLKKMLSPEGAGDAKECSTSCESILALSCWPLQG
jgi:hypothetical protein